MEQDHRKEMEGILIGFKCPKGFLCYKSGIKALCKAKDIGLKAFLLCLEKGPEECSFSRSFGTSHLCQCPLRIYIAKKLKK